MGAINFHFQLLAFTAKASFLLLKTFFMYIFETYDESSPKASLYFINLVTNDFHTLEPRLE